MFGSILHLFKKQLEMRYFCIFKVKDKNLVTKMYLLLFSSLSAGFFLIYILLLRPKRSIWTRLSQYILLNYEYFV